MLKSQIQLVLAAAAWLTFAGCREEPLDPQPLDSRPGVLEVSTVTAGDAGGDAYIIWVDQETPLSIGPNGSLRLPDLTPGEHDVLLAGFTGSCVPDENPRRIIITPGEATRVEFQVVCPRSSSITVLTRTTGESRDPNGYLLRINKGVPRRIGIDSSVELRLAPGQHSLAIEDIAPNCNSGEGTTREVSLAPGAEQQVTFDLACAFVGAVRWDTIPVPAGFSGTYAAHSVLWGTSPSSLFLIGERAIFHYDAQKWTEQARFADTELRDIAGISDRNVYAIGNTPWRGVILHYDGSQWAEVLGPATESTRVWWYNRMWQTPAGDLLVLGTVDGTAMLARYDGATWSRVMLPGEGVGQAARAATGTSLTDVWTITWTSNLCYDCTSKTSHVGHWDGAQASIVHDDTFFLYYNGILELAPNDLWVVAGDPDFAAIVHWDGATWVEQQLPDDLNGLSDIWASSSSDIYAVGPDVLLRFDGSSWSQLPGLGGYRVWGRSRDDVYLFTGGLIIHGRP